LFVLALWYFAWLANQVLFFWAATSKPIEPASIQNTTGARRTEVRKQSLIKPAWMPMRKKRTLAIKKMMHLFS
jgi:hypothetical protein